MSAGKRADASQADLLSQVQDFCTSHYFEEEFETFARENAHIFIRSLEMKDGEEQPLEFHEVYRKYISKFEGLIERFIEQVTFIPPYVLN